MITRFDERGDDWGPRTEDLRDLVRVALGKLTVKSGVIRLKRRGWDDMDAREFLAIAKDTKTTLFREVRW